MFNKRRGASLPMHDVSRMVVEYFIAQMRTVDVGIDFRGGYVFMT
jgi:hypothetical protein